MPCPVLVAPQSAAAAGPMLLANLQGSELGSPLRCTFANASAQVSMPAVVVNASAAVCTAPPWAVGPEGAAVTLTLVSGKCRAKLQYFYYPAPLVRAVHPQAAPRYGSFQMMVSVDRDLLAITGDQVGVGCRCVACSQQYFVIAAGLHACM